jgi:Trypsin-like serine proteases, typically periplasmic, contain C-terminal PDZ domain
MKAVKLNIFSFFMVMMLCTGMHHLQAQQEINVETDGKTITIIKKYIDDEGISVTEKIIKQLDDANDFDIDELIGDLPGAEVNIEIMKDIDTDELDNSLSQMDQFMFGKSGCAKTSVTVSPNNRGKLGVYLESHSGIDEGIKIKSIVKGGAVEKVGIQAGDIILAINDKKTNSYNALTNTMREYSIDDVVRVDYQRGTEYFQSEVTLKGHIKPERKNRYAYGFVTPSDRSYFKMDPCKPFIGVTLSLRGEKGVPVHSIVDDTPASEVALQKGDQIISIDGTPVKTQSEIVRLRDLHKAGDYFTIGYLRDGQEFEVEARFKACDSEEIVIEEEEPINLNPTTIEKPIITNDLNLESITAFPNPTSGRVTLQFKGEPVPTTVRLTDALGKVLMTEKLSDFSGEYNDKINLSNYPSGLYNITIIQNGKSYSERIVLNGNRT